MKKFDLSKTTFTQCESIVSKHEKKLYDVLLENLDHHYKNQYLIFPKVRIGDVITMTKNSFSRSIWGRYKSRHFDFLICSKDNLQPVLAIELQDNSHKSKKGKYVDLLKRRLCERAGLNLLQLWTTNSRHIKNLLYYRLQDNLQNS